MLDSRSTLGINLRNRSLRYAQTAFGAAWTAEWAFTVALGIVAARHGGAMAVGAVALLRMLPTAVLGPLLAPIADRLPRERVMIAIGLIRAVATAGAAVTIAQGTSMVWVYALATVATVFAQLYRSAHSALLPCLCRTPREARAASIARGFVGSASRFTGPFFAALLLEVSGIFSVLTAIAVLSLLAGLLMIPVKYEAPGRKKAKHRPNLWRETKEGLSVIRRDETVSTLIRVAMSQAFTAGAFGVFSVVVAIDLLNTGEAGVGLLSGAVGVGSIVGASASSLLNRSSKLAAWFGIGVALWGIPLMLIGLYPHSTAALILLGFVGWGNALMTIGTLSLLPRLVEERLLARVFMSFEALLTLGAAIGSIVTPILITTIGIRPALIIIGTLCPALVVSFWRPLRILDSKLLRRDQDIRVLRKVPLLKPLPAPTIEQLARTLTSKLVAPGTTVIREGDKTEEFYVIASGELNVVADGRPVTTLRKGDHFGEFALLREIPQPVTVQASDECHIFQVPTAEFIPAVSACNSAMSEADAVIDAKIDLMEQALLDDEDVVTNRFRRDKVAVGAGAGGT